MRVHFLPALGLMLAMLTIARPAVAQPPTPLKVDFAKQLQPILKAHCLACHDEKKAKGGVNLELVPDDRAFAHDRAMWEKVAQVIRSREMPPEGRARPLQAEIELLTGWLDAQLARVDCGKDRDPGRVTLRRLNRAEYNNTIRDLLGLAIRPADDFPSDDVGYGFDNIGDVLTLPPLLLEKYLAAAEKIADQVFKEPEARRRLMICEPEASNTAECAAKVLEAFASRAYRRPATREEVRRLAGLVRLAETQGDPFEKGLQLAVQAVLVSPHFLFRVESDAPNQPDGSHRVTDLELASRLSYFLWSTMPDGELLDLARKGQLRQGSNLETQARRLLQDGKAHALVENFAGQWLQYRNVKAAMPDTGRFRGFDDALKTAMARETELFVEAIIHDDRPILEFIDADYTFLNERLARLSGIDGVQGDDFRRVALTGDQRGGVLTQASILTVTSNPTRTSPVKRGKYILETILGTPPPPPPPDVPELNEDQQVVASGTLRQRLEHHRKNAGCASCHQRLDPLGFGLENFDAVGRWRTQDGKFPVDATGTLPDGQTFEGPAGLKGVLRKQAGAFRRCLGEKLLTYAIGRGLEYYDKCAIDAVAATAEKDGDRFSSLVLAIVQSDPFQMRRAKRSNP